MPLKALIICSDSQLLQLAVPVFEEACIDTDVCTAPAHGQRLMHREKYDAVMIDCAAEDSAAILAKSHDYAFNRTSLVFALVSGSIEAREAVRLGANFVLEKPLTREWLLRSLRAAYGLMISDRRRCFRHPVELTVWISTDGIPELPAMTMNVSQGGMSVRSAIPIGQKGKIILKFQLPGGGRALTARAEIRWTRADLLGIEFTAMSRSDRNELASWLGERFDENVGPSRSPASIHATP